MGRKHKYQLPQSYEEALELQILGLAPSRPRNEFEKMAKAVVSGRHGPGRPVNPTSRSQLALELASYLVDSDGKTLKAAAKLSAAAYRLSSIDNLRSGLRQRMAGTQTTIQPGKGKRGIWGALISPETVPQFLGAVDAVSGTMTAKTQDPDGLEQLASLVSNRPRL